MRRVVRPFVYRLERALGVQRTNTGWPAGRFPGNMQSSPEKGGNPEKKVAVLNSGKFPGTICGLIPFCFNGFISIFCQKTRVNIDNEFL